MFHRRAGLASRVRVTAGGLMPHQGLAGYRVLAFCETLEPLVVDVPDKSPPLRQLAVPCAPDNGAGGVVVDARVAELFGVIRARLFRTERLGQSQHSMSPINRTREAASRQKPFG
jgi:hypothetical protein